MPSLRRRTEQARDESLITALWLSVTFAAAILPFRSLAFLRKSEVSVPFGGHISAVIVNLPERIESLKDCIIDFCL